MMVMSEDRWQWATRRSDDDMGRQIRSSSGSAMSLIDGCRHMSSMKRWERKMGNYRNQLGRKRSGQPAALHSDEGRSLRQGLHDEAVAGINREQQQWEVAGVIKREKEMEKENAAMQRLAARRRRGRQGEYDGRTTVGELYGWGTVHACVSA